MVLAQVFILCTFNIAIYMRDLLTALMGAKHRVVLGKHHVFGRRRSVAGGGRHHLGGGVIGFGLMTETEIGQLPGSSGKRFLLL